MKFGDKLHILGEEYVFIKEVEEGEFQTVDPRGKVEVCRSSVFDEYKPNPKEERRKELLGLWRNQSIDFAHDNYDSASLLGELFDWMENNKHEIITILTK